MLGSTMPVNVSVSLMVGMLLCANAAAGIITAAPKTIAAQCLPRIKPPVFTLGAVCQVNQK